MKYPHRHVLVLAASLVLCSCSELKDLLGIKSNHQPEMLSLSTDAITVVAGAEIPVLCTAWDSDGDYLYYDWSAVPMAEYSDGWVPRTIADTELGKPGRWVAKNATAIWVAPTEIGEGVRFGHPWRQIGVSIVCQVNDGRAYSKKDTIFVRLSSSKSVQIVTPSSDVEVGILGELSVVASAGTVDSVDYPEGIEVTVERLDPDDENLEAYGAISPLALIYKVDASAAPSTAPFTVRIPMSNIQAPDEVEPEDLQIVKWQDLGNIEFLQTAIGPRREFLEADVTSFSYFTVRLSPTVSFFGGSVFNLTEPLRVSLEGDRLAFGNLFARTTINIWRRFSVVLTTPQSLWVNYQVEVLRDELFGETLVSAMQVFRIEWCPADLYDAYRISHNFAIDDLPRCLYRFRRCESHTSGVIGKEVVVVFDRDGRPGEPVEETVAIGDNPATAGDFLRQVFRSDATRLFVEATSIDDASAKYFLRITRQYVALPRLR